MSQATRDQSILIDRINLEEERIIHCKRVMPSSTSPHADINKTASKIPTIVPPYLHKQKERTPIQMMVYAGDVLLVLSAPSNSSVADHSQPPSNPLHQNRWLSTSAF